MSGTASPAAQAIIFNEIPTGILVPGEYTEIRPFYGNVGMLGYPTRVLMYAQMSPARGNGNGNTRYTVTSADQVTALCGAGSPASAAAAAYFLGNPLAQLDIVTLLPPNTATSASGTFTVTGAPTAPGTVSIGVGGRNYRVGVSLTDTPSSISANLRAAINADPNAAAAGAAAAGVLTTTAAFKGALGNDIDLRINPLLGDTLPPGIAIAVVPMSGGNLNPDCTAAIALVATIWYTDIIMPFYDPANLALLSADLDRRYTALGKQDAMSWTAYNGSYGSAQTFAAGQNDRHMCFLPMYNSQSPPYAVCGALAGVASFALANDPSRQLRGLTLPGVTGPFDSDAFIESQQQLLLQVGQSTFTTENSVITIQRLITANTTTTLGVADASWRDVMTARTLSRIRYDWNSYRALTYPQAKLAPDGSLAAQSDVAGTLTPMRARGSWAGRCRLYEQLGWIVNGQAAAQQSIFQINSSDASRLDQQLYVNITGNLMVDASVIEFQIGA